VWLKLSLTPKRFHLKRYRLDYQPLFRKGAKASRPDSIARDQLKSIKERKNGVFDYYFFECTLKYTLTTKYSGVSSRPPYRILDTPP